MGTAGSLGAKVGLSLAQRRGGGGGGEMVVRGEEEGWREGEEEGRLGEGE